MFIHVFSCFRGLYQVVRTLKIGGLYRYFFLVPCFLFLGNLIRTYWGAQVIFTFMKICTEMVLNGVKWELDKHLWLSKALTKIGVALRVGNIDIIFIHQCLTLSTQPSIAPLLLSCYDWYSNLVQWKETAAISIYKIDAKTTRICNSNLIRSMVK